ncbi:hypothetical protein, variant [Puccinia triticina 1-1 BBBD Race 1]|uniref:Uncharacterized protein n=2 Tax=Puccinia triticina TaxID=208348 RepID=A0A180H477_PUCT1|nr:uncharacterized protein PtA15_2A603 [Puccinia triticina]OAV99794.1 hypothetical protein PTTG_00450 [Puccinia triticina 1-1 BBBD Race 1]OAV99795.1 hypothetical protein, variant [Puccinia triticina 1-1 BBBD Race 1]WAQ82286.1 hypothetical protein PtA15_2A603 [Puccinia triticina]WAR53140.1 hypothetical protein PtB15_2B571 [Puccinia triticina]
MTLTDDESDLSETLSSAGSTIPLPSSELGSRAPSEDPTSPSGLAHSSKPFPKLDRRRKSRFIKPKNNSSTPSLPTPNPDKDPKLRKHRPSARPTGPANGPVASSSSTSPSGRLIKAESLPPPSPENGIHPNSISTNLPRPTSAKGAVFESQPHTTLEGGAPSNSPNSIPHPCTSHGHLPLFEQPVLLQGARPRRKPHSMTTKSKKTNKGRKPKGYNSVAKPTPSSLDQDFTNHSTMDHDDSATTTAATFKDDESSLTEQSSSDEASLTDRPMACSRTASPSHNFSQSLPELDSAQVASRLEDHWPNSTHDRRPSLSSTTQSFPQPHHSSIDATSAPDPTSTKCNPVKLPEALHSPRIPHPDLSHVSSPSALLNGPAQIQKPPATSCRIQKVNGRNTSEESALTPDPEDARPGTDQPTRPKPPHSSQNTPNRTSAPVLNSRHLSSTCPSPVRSPHADQSATNHPPPSTFTDDIAISTAGLNHKSRPPNIIPPSTLKPNLGTTTTVDRTVEGDLHSAAFVTDRSSASPLPTRNYLEPSVFPRDPSEHLTDDALDGEPIVDDMMEYELDLDDDEPTDIMMDLRQEPSEAGTSAVDGVPVPDSEDVLEYLDAQPSLNPQSPHPTCYTELDSPPPPKSRQSPESEQEPPKPRTEKLKPSKTHPPEVIYEHDDHVRRREDALEAMVKIEIMFAQVRDRLYVERLSDVHRETAAVHHGSHPELNEYYQLLEKKRDARLSLAHKIFNLKEIELTKKREAATNSVWTSWYEAKTELHDSMILETQKQIKQLEREKCQPDLRYNVEVQLLPRPIIPRHNPGRRSRKRARLEMGETSEEILAIQFHTAIAKRATVNLSTLTAEESCADLSVMKPQSRNSHLDPVNILCAPHNMATYFRDDPSEPATELSKKLAATLGSPDKLDNQHSARDPAIIGAEKLIALNPKLAHSRGSYPSQAQSLSSPSSRFELNKHSSRRLDNLTNIHTSSSRTVRNSNRLTSEQTEPELNRLTGGASNGQYFKSDRRPTLDAVMAHNTPERLKGQLKAPNGSSDPVSYTLTTACIGSSPSQISHHQLPPNHHRHHQTPNIQNNQNRSNHPTQLYPSVPLSVNYHERVKSQLA